MLSRHNNFLPAILHFSILAIFAVSSVRELTDASMRHSCLVGNADNKKGGGQQSVRMLRTSTSRDSEGLGIAVVNSSRSILHARFALGVMRIIHTQRARVRDRITRDGNWFFGHSRPQCPITTPKSCGVIESCATVGNMSKPA